MAVTKQGLRFFRETTPEEASFIDSGRIIRVYRQDGETLLAALQLAQEKWGGVKITGTDEYKRRCAELAVEYGIRVVNPELQGFIKEIGGLKSEPVTPIPVLTEKVCHKPALSLEAARNIIEVEARTLEMRHRKLYDTYAEHKKTLREHIESEPKKPLILGVKKWKQEHEQWKIEGDNLEHLIIDDLKALGVDTDKPDIAEREAEYRYKSIQVYAHSEAVRLHPDAAEVIRLDKIRMEREEREAKERERAINEKFNKLRASVRKLAEAKTSEHVFIVTDDQEGKKYSGVLIGVVEQNDRYVAVQALHGGHVIIHDINKNDVDRVESLAGSHVELSGEDDSFRIEVESRERNERNRGWGR
jgi:hypothetical protein